MTDKLGEFVRDYRSRAVPPPHILLVGPDKHRCESIAADFAQRLGLALYPVDAGSIESVGDITAILTNKHVAFISSVHLLKRAFLENLTGDLIAGIREIRIGQGPAVRVHRMEIEGIVIATVPSKYDCPSLLNKAFETILHVDPPTQSELIAILESEAWKSRISLDRDASELLIRASGNKSEVLFSHFKRVCSVIEQIKITNKPVLTLQEVSDAMGRLRIRVPSSAPPADTIDIHSLSGQEFESVIKSLLMEMGFEAELTEITGDGGIDIIAKLEKPFVRGRYLFQCKRYASKNLVGAPEVRDFYGAVMADRAMKGIFITTSDFTSQAKEFASQSGVELVNLPKLLQLFAEHGLANYA